MTYKVLTADTHKIIHRSGLRSADAAPYPNRRADRTLWDDVEDDDLPSVVTNDVNRDTDCASAAITFNPEEILGKTFLITTDDENIRRRVRISELLDVSYEP